MAIFGLLVLGTYDLVVHSELWNQILKDSPEGLILKYTATTPYYNSTLIVGWGVSNKRLVEELF